VAHDILIVDDEADIRMLIAGILEDEGYEPREAGDSVTALAAIRARQPGLVVQDVWLEGSPMDGLEVLKTIKAEHPNVPVVMISGHGNVEMAVDAIRLGAYDFIEKPFKTDRLLLVVSRAIEAARLKRENDELRLRAGPQAELIGISPLIAGLRSTVEKAAPTGSRVLITGPAGSGKEVVARLLHQRSRRATGSFIVVNCATMAPERMELALFGSERGDGVGQPRRVGLLEQAHGGTLLLDEISDMPLETQGKIVRVLQEQTFERVGGTARVAVDVRVIASSNKDLRDEITAGRFREDLYYRLNVVPISVPPLRHRREDIPVLARHFLQLSAEVAGLSMRQLGEDALAALQSYEWPGNVRQLRNVLDWLLIMVSGDAKQPIKADQLPPEINATTPGMLQLDRAGEMIALPLREAREMFEREYLLAQVHRFGGNISRTASFIGMERSALHRKLKSLGVQIASERV
jgi:two-component system nitrogen regulation response regulator NtrX